jgi:long-chain fatty acid transport protein
MKRMHRLATIVAITVLAVLQPAAHGGGVWLYETDPGNVGLAAAGMAARAQDATTAYNNPAGMTLLSQPQMTMTAQMLYGNLIFRPDHRTTTDGSNGGNAIGWMPGGGFAFVQPLSKDWRFGISTFSNFGLALDYNNDWVGRYYLQNATLIGMTVMPSLAYRVDDNLSVGMGFNAMYAVLKEHMAVNNVIDAMGDGGMELSDRTWGYGVTPGIMYEFSKRTRVGLTYTSPMDLDFTVKPTFQNLGPGLGAVAARLHSIDMSMTVPQTVMASIYHELDEKWAVMANAGWQDWSEFGKVDVSVNAQNQTDTTTQLNFNDTWHTAAGVQYKIAPTWLVSTGLAYDSSMVDDKNRTPSMPVGEAIRWGLGLQHDLSASTTVALAYEMAYSGDAPVNQQRGPLSGRLAGEYSDVTIQFFSASLTHRF